MSRRAGLVALGLGALGTVLALWPWRGAPAPGAEPRPEVVPAPLEPPEGVDEFLRAREERARLAESVPAAFPRVAPEPETSAPAPEETSSALRIGARLLDEEARPVDGGTLAWLRLDPTGPSEARSASSDGTGAVWLALPRAELPAEGPLVLAAGGVGRLRLVLPLDRARWETSDTVSLGELTLRAGGALEGRVVDEHGTPVEGAWVALSAELGELPAGERPWARLLPLVQDTGTGSGPLLGTTDGEGRYRLDGAPTGRFAVVAMVRPASAEARLPDREEGLVVRGGEATRVRDLVLRAPSPDEVLAGVVLAPDGAPVAGAALSLDDGDVVRGQGLSDVQGRFALLAPPDAGYRLRASDPGARWRPVEESDARPGAGPLVLRFAGPMPSRAAPPPPAPERSTDAGASQLHGRLTLSGRPALGWSASVLLRRIRLDGEGEFRLAGLRPGKGFLVLATDPGRAVLRTIAVPLELREGANEWELDLPVGGLVLEHLPPVEPAEFNGSAAPGYVLAGELAGGSWTILFLGEGGRVELEDVPAGPCVLRARAPDSSAEDPSGWPVLRALDLAPGATLRITLP